MSLNKKARTVITTFLFIFIFIYILGTYTLTSYEQEVKMNSSINLAKWNITVNGSNITDYCEEELEITDITWEGTNTRDNKLAPGSKGTAKIVISPNDTEVAIKYDLTFIDKSVDENKILTITNIKDEDGDLIKTQENTYTGIFSLEDINNGKTKTLTIDLEWIDSNDTNEFDTKVGMGEIEAEFTTINMIATQYNGEEIIEYEKVE